MSWIDQLIRHLEQVTCSGCGEYYHGGDIAAVVTEPSRLVRPDRAGLRLLYVTITRATKSLTIVHADALPEGLA